MLQPWGLWLILAPAALLSPTLSRAQTSLGQEPAAAGSIQGVVTFVNQQGETSPLQEAHLTLTPASGGRAALTTTSDEQGHYQFADVPANVYQLEVSVDGFQTQTITVPLTKGQTLVRNFTLHLATVVQTTEVREEAAEIATENANASATVSSTQIEDMPLQQQTAKAALPEVPGVIKTPNGVLNMKGVSENQGMLLVDSLETVDPVTGRFSIPIPSDVIQSLSVVNSAYNAEYGGFSGGLTEIHTKPPADTWQFGINDFFPGLRGKNGHLRGISDEQPRIYLTGPLWKGKLNFSQTVTYAFIRQPVRGLAWPLNETVTQGFSTFTNLQAILSSRHLLNVSLDSFSHRVQFANIDALLPQVASSDDGQHGFSVGGNDSYEFLSGMILATALRYTDFDSSAHGQGSQTMLLTPDGWDGNYFNNWRRVSNEVQFFPSLRFPAVTWRGRHEVKIGASLTRRSFIGASWSHPVQVLREDGSVASQIDFQGTGMTHGKDIETSEFIQDHWTLNSHLSVDLGGRLVSQSGGRDAAFEPRLGLSYSPGKGQKNVIYAGAGIFYDRVPLLATDFTGNLTRVVNTFDDTGHLVGSPVTFQNVYLQPASGGGFVPTSNPLDKFSRNFTWNAEWDRQLRHDMQLRVSYLRSQTIDSPIVVPLAGAAGSPSYLGLADTGISHYYEVQAVLRYQPAERKQLNISYIHSHSHGDINALSDIYVPFEQPIIRPDRIGVLPADVPDRVVAWGIVGLPFQLTASPILDVHTGLPYSAVDAFQNYVGAPDSRRYPYYLSVDLQVYKEFRLSSLPLLSRAKNRTFRLGIFSFNLTSRKNPNAVFNNITSPNFGTFTGFDRRIDGFVFEVH
jgi:hypothetical protein